MRSRPVLDHIAAVYLKAKVQAANQLLYQTTDSTGNPSRTVTTVLVPYNGDYNKFIQCHIAQDSDYSECTPSYSMQFLSDPAEAIVQVEMAAVTIVLNIGVVVAVPDYEGPNNACGAGLMAGYAPLDSVRAVLQSNGVTGVSADAKATLMGNSGGSIPVGHAAELENTYALRPWIALFWDILWAVLWPT